MRSEVVSGFTPLSCSGVRVFKGWWDLYGNSIDQLSEGDRKSYSLSSRLIAMRTYNYRLNFLLSWVRY